MFRGTTPSSSRFATRPAFTLVELLVTLLIIALLISILLPALNAVRSRAKSTACKANLNTIGQAMRMYLNENRNRYPRAPALPSVNPRNYPSLMQHLRPYVGKDERVFQCPADEELFAKDKISYFYNTQLGTDPLEDNLFLKIFKSKQWVPVALDAAEFHGDAKPINCLFLDLRVEQIDRPKGVP